VSNSRDEVIITVTGNGFLYNMVRIIVGTLLQIGRGKGRPEDVKGMLEAKDRSKAGPTAPPQGLYLVEYKFKI
jgi:tRNA pseudouridine38-40 synthase